MQAHAGDKCCDRCDVAFGSGEEVEAYMLANSIVETNSREADAPTNQPCENEMQGGDITFR